MTTGTATTIGIPTARRGPAGIALSIGLVGIAIALVGLFTGLLTGEARPFMSWLIGFTFWLSIAVGMLFLVMLFYIFDAGWPIVVRRQLEHGLAAFKWLALLFVPLLAVALFWFPNRGILWPWMSEQTVLPGGERVGEDVLFLAKEAFLNPLAFTIGTALIFGVFVVLSHLLRQHSFDCDADGKASHYAACRRIAAFGVPLTALAATFGAIYWIKSIEYHWFSTMYGVWFFSASIWSANAMAILLLALLGKEGRPLHGIVGRNHFYLLGCMQLAFTVFWAYISFSEYFLIYSANIPEETIYYNIRLLDADTWRYGEGYALALALIFGHFLLPFLCLLWYRTKVDLTRAVMLMGWILVFHLLDVYWRVVPTKVATDAMGGYAFRSLMPSFHTLFDIAALVGIGGICVWAFLKSQRSTKVIPIHDPKILDSLEGHD